jgi:hypothetical protein
MSTAFLSDGTTFECSNGGVITVQDDGVMTELERFGDDGEFAYYDDLHLDSYNDLFIDVSADYNVKGTVKHLTGDQIMTFQLSSREPNGKVDVKLTGLQENAWYRLRLGGALAACEGGRATGKTNERGILHFIKVEIPNE